jgi:hypothetical protein
LPLARGHLLAAFVYRISVVGDAHGVEQRQFDLGQLPGLNQQGDRARAVLGQCACAKAAQCGQRQRAFGFVPALADAFGAAAQVGGAGVAAVRKDTTRDMRGTRLHQPANCRSAPFMRFFKHF